LWCAGFLSSEGEVNLGEKEKKTREPDSGGEISIGEAEKTSSGVGTVLNKNATEKNRPTSRYRDGNGVLFKIHAREQQEQQTRSCEN